MVIIPVMVIFLGASGCEEIEIEYVQIGDVQAHLDCDTGLSNGKKAEFFRTKYRGRRLIFSETVISKFSSTEYVLNGLTLSRSVSRFNCLPRIVLSHANTIPVRDKSTYEFDCRIVDFCEDGIFDGQIRFVDCKALREIKLPYYQN